MSKSIYCALCSSFTTTAVDGKKDHQPLNIQSNTRLQFLLAICRLVAHDPDFSWLNIEILSWDLFCLLMSKCSPANWSDMSISSSAHTQQKLVKVHVSMHMKDTQCPSYSCWPSLVDHRCCVLSLGACYIFFDTPLKSSHWISITHSSSPTLLPKYAQLSENNLTLKSDKCQTERLKSDVPQNLLFEQTTNSIPRTHFAVAPQVWLSVVS